MKIIPLSEGTFTIDQTKLFVPFNDREHSIEDRTAGSLMVEIQPFIVVTSRDVILLDAGLGFEKDGKLQLHKNIIDAGLNPSEITKVLMTHLHKDHAGGVSDMIETSNRHRIAFPQATFYVQKKEMEYALQKGFPSYIPDEIISLKDFPGVEWLDGNGTIDGYIRYELSGGHSPFHQVFWIEEDGETIFYGGDEAPQYNQMVKRYAAKYDFDGKKAMQMRDVWWKKGAEEKWTFLFYHDFKRPTYKAGN